MRKTLILLVCAAMLTSLTLPVALAGGDSGGGGTFPGSVEPMSRGDGPGPGVPGSVEPMGGGDGPGPGIPGSVEPMGGGGPGGGGLPG